MAHNQPENDDQQNWINRTFQQARWRTETQNTSLLLAGVVIVAVIGALYLAQASRTSAAGRRLQEMEAQRELLEQQNAQLRAEVAALQSVPRLIGEAERQGYRQARPDEVIYMDLSDIPAPIQPTPTPLPLEVVVPEYDETLESWLAKQFTRVRDRVNAREERIQNEQGAAGSGESDTQP